MASGKARKREKIHHRPGPSIMEVMQRADAQDLRRQEQASNQVEVINRLQDRLADRDAVIAKMQRHLNVAHAGHGCAYTDCEVGA